MPEPKFRRFPKPIWFGVAAVVMVVLYVFLSVWLPYHREQVAIREIERLGGYVGTAWEGPEWMKTDPVWMVEWLSWFDRVYSVELFDASIGDEGLKHLNGMVNLVHLDLENTQVTNEGLKHISGLTNLEVLQCESTQISDNGLKHLGGLTNLDLLFLENTQVTTEGIKELQKALPNCYIRF